MKWGCELSCVAWQGCLTRSMWPGTDLQVVRAVCGSFVLGSATSQRTCKYARTPSDICQDLSDYSLRPDGWANNGVGPPATFDSLSEFRLFSPSCSS